MNPRIRYCVELDQIKDMPDFNRIRAEIRFFLIKEFIDNFDPEEKKRLGNKYRVKPATQAYCQSKGVALNSFFRWLRQYRRFGIAGLVPRYGRHLSATKTNPPHRHLQVVIDLDPWHPLGCLPQILKVIKTHPAIPGEQAKIAGEYLERELHLLRRQTRLNLPRALTKAEVDTLLAYRASTHKNHYAKALILLMVNEGRSMDEIVKASGRAPGTIYRHLRLFHAKGLDFIEVRMDAAGHERVWKERTVRVVGILHETPRLYGINRTTWTSPTIRQAYQQTYGEKLSHGAVGRIVKAAGYSWRRARKVLTSPDPEYSNKLCEIMEVLHGLKPDDAFFFIDEAGPWRVKKYGGKALTPKGTTRLIPDSQESKGSIYLIAALEAQTNQVTWRFIGGKNTTAIISLLRAIRQQYSHSRRLCITWDALSTHGAGEVKDWISVANKQSQGDGAPVIEVYPLPSNAQFLNVVESTFSSLRRAVIHNSDYATKEEMKEAIRLYFEERNAYFLKNPKRAGNKIWDREIFKIEELPGGLFRRM